MRGWRSTAAIRRGFRLSDFSPERNGCMRSTAANWAAPSRQEPMAPRLSAFWDTEGSRDWVFRSKQLMSEAASPGGCRFGAGLGWWIRFRPDPHCPALRLIDIERPGLSDQIAQFSIAISARVEIGGNVRKALPHRTQADPTIFRLHLHHGLIQERNGRARRL